jgi:hypothetical protein
MASEPENVADVGNRKSHVLTLAITLTVRFLGKMFNLKKGGRQTSHPPRNNILWAVISLRQW